MQALRFGVLFLAATTAACRLTEVALVTVKNDTASDVSVRSLLRGHADFGEPMALRPQQESTLIKYEEPRGETAPLSEYVVKMRLETPKACVVTLESSALKSAAVRNDDRRRWTVHVTPDVLQNAGCVTPAP